MELTGPYFHDGGQASLEQVVFKYARPGNVIVTTPNFEYNSVWDSLRAGEMRHPDHRFEWNRAEFRNWASRVAQQNRYLVRFDGIGHEMEKIGFPTQMAIFYDNDKLTEHDLEFRQ